MNKPKPGTIQMKHGRWRIFTADRGFRPHWVPLDGAFIARAINRWADHASDALQRSRAFHWTGELTAGNLRSVMLDMRYIATKSPTTRWEKLCAEWAQWINYLLMVNTAKAK